MKYIILLIIIFFNLSNNLSAQDEYFQQKTDFNIKADLNLVNKSLKGNIELKYYNNSLDNLKEIYFHLHANAFNNKSSLFAKGLLNEDETDLYFTKPSDMGGYEEISFISEKTNLKWIYTDSSKQIVKVSLKTPLKPEDAINILISYQLKIPEDVFGFGYKNNQFNMVYWYPKPAVYDNNGWHLNQLNVNNLNYSNFGDYNVSITVPKNYLVASSGILNTKSEIATIEEIITQNKTDGSNEKPFNDSLGIKQIEFQAKNINDFVWFANPNFKITKTNTNKYRNDNIILYVYYNSKRLKKQDVDSIINKSMQLIQDNSKKFGTYPNKQISLVLSDNISKNGFYPMLITAKAKDYRRKYSEFYQNLIYNINSSWINSIFSINGNEYPWMQLGIPEFYKKNYIENNYDPKDKIRRNYTTFKESSDAFAKYIYLKPANLRASGYDFYKELIMFSKYKTAFSLEYLENYLGAELFNKIMYAFTSNWKFHHPTSDDFKNHFESFTKKDLNWFFDGLLGDPNPFKYNIKSVIQTANEYIVDIENKGKYKIPFKLGYLFEATSPKYLQVEGFLGTKEIILEESLIDRIKIDPFDLYYKDKKLKTKVKTSKKLKNNKNLSFFKKKRRSHFMIPSLGFNANDGFLLGLLVSSFNTKNLDYYIAPMYGFRSKTIVGIGNYSRNFILNKKIKRIKVGVNTRSFHRLKRDDFKLRYIRFSPYINFYFGKGNSCGLSDQIHYRFSYIKDETYTVNGIESYNRFINKLDYNKSGGNVITPFKLTIGLEHQYYNYYKSRNYLKIYTDLNTGYMYKKDRFISLRLYGATYIFNTNTKSTDTYPGTLSLIGNAENDYDYEDYFFDRSAQEGFWSQQISMNTGGFKTAVGRSNSVGQSNKYVVAANIRVDLPIKIFIKPFIDIGIYGDLPTVSDGYSNKLIYSGGILAEIIKDHLEIYLPILNSKEIEDIYHEKGNFFNRMSFMVKFNLPNKNL